MNNLTDKHTTYPATITPDIENRVMRAIDKTGREPRWFNIDAACNWLARHDDASADTAIKLYDYTVPRTIVEEWENGAIEATTGCWREWNGRIWRVTFFETTGGSEPLIIEVDAPGSDERPYMTEAEYLIVDASDDIDEEPTLAQLGL